jgi:hypothetical protein
VEINYGLRKTLARDVPPERLYEIWSISIAPKSPQPYMPIKMSIPSG